MKRSAVLGHTLSIALATAAAGVALCAGPASADETSQLALAPLPQVLTGTSLFGQAKGEPKGEQKGEEKGEEKGEGEEGGGHKKGQCANDWLDAHVNYRFHPVAYTLGNMTSLSNLTPNYPAAFVAKHYNMYELSRGIGPSTDIGISAVGAKLFGLQRAPLNPHPNDTEWFFGGYVQQKLVNESGVLPTISLGVRANQGSDEIGTLGGYIVGTKRLIGKPCNVAGLWVTGGYKWEGYDTDTGMANFIGLISPRGNVPPTSDDGARPFAGMNIAFSKNFAVGGEWSHRQPWQFEDMWSARGILLIWHGWGVEGGVEDNGYHERTFVALELGSFRPLIGGGR